MVSGKSPPGEIKRNELPTQGHDDKVLFAERHERTPEAACGRGETGRPHPGPSQVKQFRIGMLEGIVAPPPEEFFAPMTEDELREWEGGPDEDRGT